MTVQTEIIKIESEYSVKDGIIVSPGKFEGESIATVYFYNCTNEFGGDYSIISDEERAIFNIDPSFDCAVILTDNSGFTYLEYVVNESHAEDRVNEWYNEDGDFEEDESEESGRCSQCEAMMINGVYCHETGCPEAWKTEEVKCRNCGFDFLPEEEGRNICDDCISEADNQCTESLEGYISDLPDEIWDEN